MPAAAAMHHAHDDDVTFVSESRLIMIVMYRVVRAVGFYTDQKTRSSPA